MYMYVFNVELLSIRIFVADISKATTVKYHHDIAFNITKLDIKDSSFKYDLMDMSTH